MLDDAKGTPDGALALRTLNLLPVTQGIDPLAVAAWRHLVEAQTMDQQKQQERVTLKAAAPEEPAAVPSNAAAESAPASPVQPRNEQPRSTEPVQPTPALPPWRRHLREIVFCGFLSVAVPASIFFGSVTGDDFLVKGKADDAVKAFENHLLSDPRDVHALDQLGRIHLYKLEFQPAESCFSRALAIAPSNNDIRYLRSECYRFLQKPALALADLQKLPGKHLVDRLRCLAALPGNEAQVDALLRNILAAPNYTNQPDNRYKLFMIAGHWNDAIQVCDEQLKQHYPSPWHAAEWTSKKADALRRSGNLAAAAKTYDELGKIAPADPAAGLNLAFEAQLNHAQTLAALGRTEDAIAAYKQALVRFRGGGRVSPNQRLYQQQAYDGLKELYTKAGNPAEIKTVGFERSPTGATYIWPWQLQQLPVEPLDGTLGEYDRVFGHHAPPTYGPE